MPVAAITAITEHEIRYQWYSGGGKHRHEASLRWAGVAWVTAFKRDMFVYDLICMQFESPGCEPVEFDEEDALWTELTSALPHRLPTSLPWEKWFAEVAYPAFETNRRVLFTK